jgi:hypothetical protein
MTTVLSRPSQPRRSRQVPPERDAAWRADQSGARGLLNLRLHGTYESVAVLTRELFVKDRTEHLSPWPTNTEGHTSVLRKE